MIRLLPIREYTTEATQDTKARRKFVVDTRGRCQADADCGDGNRCTTDSCLPITGCVNTPVECEDRNA